jgi:hypothetical protein
MQTITQRKKLSKGTWVLILLAIGTVIAIAVLAAVGKIDLSPAANGVISVVSWGGLSIGNSLVILIGAFALGMLTMWSLYRWFIGQKTTIAAQGIGGGYNPAPTTPSSSQSGNETVIT